jgi:hypothetical protein
MNKLIITILLLTITIISKAQFQKSTYFENIGKAFEVGLASYSYTSNNEINIESKSPSIYITFGLDNPEYRMATHTKIGYVGSAKYNHTIRNYGIPPIPPQVYYGKTSSFGLVGIGGELRFFKQKSEKLIVFNPFISGDIDLLIKATKFTYQGDAPTGSSYKADVKATSLAIGIGGGFLVNFTKNIQLKSGISFAASNEEANDSSNIYLMNLSNKRINIGLVYRIVKED